MTTSEVRDISKWAAIILAAVSIVGGASVTSVHVVRDWEQMSASVNGLRNGVETLVSEVRTLRKAERETLERTVRLETRVEAIEGRLEVLEAWVAGLPPLLRDPGLTEGG